MLVLGVLLALLAAVLVPVIFTGTNDLQAAKSALNEGRAAEAAPLFESAARDLFWRKDLWEQAGLAAYSSGDRASSVRLLEIARQEHSISAEGWDTLGAVFWIDHDVTTAMSIWESGSQSFPKSAPLYDHLIMAYHERGNFPAEQAALIKRLSLGPDAAAHYRLGLLLTLSEIGRAQQEFNAASSLDPEYGPAATTLVSALNSAELESDPAQRLVIIGRGLGLVEEWGLALKAFEQAASLDGSNAEAWAWLGEARQHQGQDGRRELDKALSEGSR